MSRRSAYAGAIACMGLVACLGAYVLHVYISRWRARKCQTHFVLVGQGLLGYASVHGSLPPPYIQGGNGAPAHSWRVLLLPYLSYEHEYKGYRFCESWDSPDNTRFLKWMTTYACPVHSESPEMTNYVAVIGEGTLWPQPKDGTTYEMRRVGEESTPWPAARGEKLPSGSNERIVLVELLHSDIPWTEPRDISLETLLELIQDDPTGRLFCSRVKAVLAMDGSGHIRIIDASEDMDQIKTMLTRERDGLGERKRNGGE